MRDDCTADVSERGVINPAKAEIRPYGDGDPSRSSVVLRSPQARGGQDFPAMGERPGLEFLEFGSHDVSFLAEHDLCTGSQKPTLQGGIPPLALLRRRTRVRIKGLDPEVRIRIAGIVWAEIVHSLSFGGTHVIVEAIVESPEGRIYEGTRTRGPGGVVA